MTYRDIQTLKHKSWWVQVLDMSLAGRVVETARPFGGAAGFNIPFIIADMCTILSNGQERAYEASYVISPLRLHRGGGL